MKKLFLLFFLSIITSYFFINLTMLVKGKILDPQTSFSQESISDNVLKIPSAKQVLLFIYRKAKEKIVYFVLNLKNKYFLNFLEKIKPIFLKLTDSLGFLKDILK